MKKILMLLLVSVMLLSSCGDDKEREIPYVFGIHYEDAIELLKDEGFEVKAIEVDASSILDQLTYTPDNVAPGTVIKIDNYILDSLGNLTVNYEIDHYDDEKIMVSKDKSVVIYYAKELNTKTENNATANDDESNNTNNGSENTTTVQPTSTPSSAVNAITPQPTSAPSSSTNNNSKSEWKEFLDDYEEWVDDYIAITKKYKANPTDTSILSDYTEMMNDMTEWTTKANNMKGKLSSSEATEFAKELSRIANKLASAAY